MTLQTAGYEGASISEFVAALVSAGVHTVIDVRATPVSRKRGFSKRALGKALAAYGIGYVHTPALGCPRCIREEYRASGDWLRYTEQYVAYLNEQASALHDILERARAESCCLICFEADASRCHRSLVAAAVARIGDGQVDVRHLDVTPAQDSAAARHLVSADR